MFFAFAIVALCVWLSDWYPFYVEREELPIETENKKVRETNKNTWLAHHRVCD